MLVRTKVVSISMMTAVALFSCGFLFILSLNQEAVYSSVDDEQKYWAGLEGEFVKPPVATNASGMAMFETIEGNIGYILDVTSIDGVTSAQIHSGDIVENGPIVVTLFGSNGTVTGDINGTLTQGEITSSMLQGPYADMNSSQLVLAMRNITTYVDVSTVDYPNGEIRGQIMSANSTHAEIMPMK
jgi:hypothetical protein